MQGQTSIERVNVGLIVSLIALLLLVFVSVFMHQVQTKETFRVTVTVFGALPPAGFDYGWLVIVERLSYEELKNVEILIDQGTPSNCQMPLFWPFNNRTIDGRAQKVFGLSWHPSNITMVWDGGSEIFLINPTPIQGAP